MKCGNVRLWKLSWLMMALSGFAPRPGLALAASETHVSPLGRDTWSGKLGAPNAERTDGPLATLEAARRLVLREKQAEGLPRGGRTVWIHPGEYFLDKGFALTAEDSGSEESPVFYRAAEGGEVRLTGGRAIPSWRKVQDRSILNRLDPAAANHVYEVDLRAAGIHSLGRLSSRGFGRAVVPAGLELFFGGRPMTLARWPNGEFTRIAAIPKSTRDEHGGRLGALKAGFHYEGDRPKRWRDKSDIWVHGYWAYDWANSYERVASIHPARRLIRTDSPYGLFGFRAGEPGGRYYFLNILEELDEPGEWYLDRKSGLLYFWPPEPAGQESSAVSLTGSTLIQIRGAAHIVLQGLTLEMGRGSGIQVEGGNDIRITGCTVRNFGNHGVILSGGLRHAVESCRIYGTGDGGVLAEGGNRRSLSPAGHIIADNHIHHIGRWSRCYVPAIGMTGVGIHARNNLIHDHPHCAILFTGNEHLIELNEIRQVCLETGDVGAIYTGRDYTFRGNVIRHNFIHHNGGVGLSSRGIYMDDCVSGTQIYGNVLWKQKRAVFLGGGRDFLVENNVFVDCDPAVELDDRGMSQAPVWHNMVFQTMRKLLEEMKWTEAPYRTRYPELADLDRYYQQGEGVPPGNIRLKRNVCWNSRLLNLTWKATPDMVELSDNWAEGDPLFVDPENGNFRLRPDSPVWGLGFQEIPFGKIGPSPRNPKDR